MEHNHLTPSAPQWFSFARFTSIPPESLETGIIDRESLVLLNNDTISLGYKLPKRYRLNRAQKVREVYPLLLSLERVDEKSFHAFLNSLGIHPEFFLDFDNLISFQLMVDVINEFILRGESSQEDVKRIVELGQDDIYWDKFGADWKNEESIRILLLKYSLEQSFFQADFHLRLEDHQTYYHFSFIPEPHLYHFLKDVQDVTTNWLGFYRLFTLKNLCMRFMGKEIEIRFLPELSKSPLEHHFEIR